MIDTITSEIEKLRLYAAYAARIEKVITDARAQLDTERGILVAQLDRVQDHVVMEKAPGSTFGRGTLVASEGGKAVRA